MAGFVQIIEYQTSRIDEIRALGEALADRMDASAPARRIRVVSDRDRPNWYLSIVEFDSYDEAMANSNRPETQEFAGKMAALCDGPARFYNLDVIYGYDSAT